MTSAVTLLPEYTGQQPADESHVEHCDDGIGRNGTASGGTTHGIVVNKSGKGTAKSEQYLTEPFLYVMFQMNQHLSFVWLYYTAETDSFP